MRRVPRRDRDVVALVIGNGAYEHAVLVATATGNARQMAEALADLDFGVIEDVDLAVRGMQAAIRVFAVTVDAADLRQHRTTRFQQGPAGICWGAGAMRP